MVLSAAILDLIWAKFWLNFRVFLSDNLKATKVGDKDRAGDKHWLVPTGDQAHFQLKKKYCLADLFYSKSFLTQEERNSENSF